MGGFRLGLGVVLTAVALSACGTASADGSADRASPSVGGVTSAARPSGAGTVRPEGVARHSTRATFPLALRRTGGIAGFDDTVVVQATGELYVDTRAVHGRVCQLPEPQRLELLDVLSTLRVAGDEVTAAPEPQRDVIRISLTDAHHLPFDLSDPSLGSVSGIVNALISDVTLTSPAGATCRSTTS